jgi:hypothetical protein
MATAESLAQELRSRGWNATAVEAGTGDVCEIDEVDHDHPVDLNVYDYGLNGDVWHVGSTTHEAPQYIDASALADLVIGSVRAT